MLHHSYFSVTCDCHDNYFLYHQSGLALDFGSLFAIVMPECVCQYFRERTDLDPKNQDQDVVRFITANRHKIRGYKRFVCKRDNKPIPTVLRPLLAGYSCIVKLNISGGHFVLQENDKLRCLTPTVDSFLLVREAFEIESPQDIDMSISTGPCTKYFFLFSFDITNDVVEIVSKAVKGNGKTAILIHLNGEKVASSEHCETGIIKFK